LIQGETPLALRITFTKTGTNGENAIVGDLTLFDGTTVLKKSTGFSGGDVFNPIDDGTYRIHLDIRGDESSDQANTDGTLKPFFGIQKIGQTIPDDNGVLYNGQTEWGTLRARLNPPPGAPDHGDYLHGKQRPRDYTHGCVCERSEVILNYLWNLANPPAAFDFVVSGGEPFNLEVLIRKNAAEGRQGSVGRRIHEIRAAIGGGFDITLDVDPTAYRTTSEVVQMALATAAAVDAEVQLELFTGTNMIRRVAAFDVPGPKSRGASQSIRRLATQRNPDTGRNWLELFVADGAGVETQYFAHDPAVQRLCHLVVWLKQPFNFTDEDKEITSVKLGAPPAAR